MKIRRMAMAAAALTVALAAGAYDFSATHKGTEIYYDITAAGDASVTHSGESSLYNSYSGTVEIPAEVSFGGRSLAVTAIGDKAFACCPDLRRVTLPPTLTSIGRRAFLGCRSLEDIDLPEGLAVIADGAFAWCDALTSVSLPRSLSSLSPTAFDGCLSLTGIDIAAGGSYASADGVVTDRAGTTVVAYPPGRGGACAVPPLTRSIAPLAFHASAITEVTLPQGLTDIGDGAFRFSGALRSVTVPASVTAIGAGAFADCFSLEAISVDPGNSAYASDEGMLYDKTLTTLLQCPAGIYEMPDINSAATAIAPQAFYRCNGLCAVDIPEGVAVIGEAAFIDCQGVSTVSLPATTAAIGDMAFGQCAALEHVYIAAADPLAVDAAAEAFANCPLDKCTLYVPAEAVETYRHIRPWSDFAVIEGYKALKRQQIDWEQNLKPETGDHATLSARASSGLPVTYTVSPLGQGYASVSYDKVTFTDPGDVVITATQTGNHEYLPATPVVKVINVKGTQGVDDVGADIPTRVYALDGAIHIQGAPEGAQVRVFTADGSCMYNGRRTSITLPRGRIYIVRVAGTSHKIHL